MTNHLKSVILTVILLAGIPSTDALPQDSQYFLHTVTQGQGLYSISRMYGVSEEDIIKANPGSETVIRIGEELRIPRSQKIKFHTIEKGETLYRLSVENNVSVKEIMDANPGLSAENFKIGQVITIPAPTGSDPLTATIETAGQELPEEIAKATESLTTDDAPYKTIHPVKRRETIYRISRAYGISEEEFLQANPKYRNSRLRNGDEVIIPFSAQELAEREKERMQAEITLESIADSTLFMLHDLKKRHEPGTVNAALILPLSLSDSSSVEQMMMVEFCQGVFLGIEKLKNENISVNLKIIDSGTPKTTRTSSVFSGIEDADLVIFGSKESDQIATASTWSTENGIPLVLPLNTNADFVFTNPHVFQLNTPQSYIYQEVYNHFFRVFDRPKIFMIDAGDNSQKEFMAGFRQAANERNIPFETILLDSIHEDISRSKYKDSEDENVKQIDEKIMELLSLDRQNIFIINSKESAPLASFLPVLQLISRNKQEGMETYLFGYPEYQTYAVDHLDEMYEVDTWFYSWFYTNNMLRESVDFGASFRRAFSRQMMISYPSYASYGFDTSYYFLKGISLYGDEFENNLHAIQTNPVQMGFKFERVNNWGGFINRKVFFIHLSNQYKVEKIDFDQ